MSTSQLAVTQFTSTMKIVLMNKFIGWPSTSIMGKFARDFENFYKIPYVVGAVDGSHIPIVAPRLHAVNYYNRK